jgi:hypothetical protein
LLGEAEFGLIVVASTLLEGFDYCISPILMPCLLPFWWVLVLLLQACTDVFVGCYGMRKYDV